VKKSDIILSSLVLKGDIILSLVLKSDISDISSILSRKIIEIDCVVFVTKLEKILYETRSMSSAKKTLILQFVA
jgi:hypothetical protein